MTDRRRETEELIQATRQVLASLQSGQPDRLESARRRLLESLEKSRAAGPIEPDAVAELSNLTRVCQSLATQHQSEVRHLLGRISRTRKALQSTRQVGQSPTSSIDQTG